MRQFSVSHLLLTTMMVSGLGCDESSLPEDVDAIDADFVTGKADGGLTPAEIQGVLEVANTEDFDTLDEPAGDGGVGLDRRAAQGIVDFRAGPDGALETADDTEFATLEALDDIAYVGPVALTRLLDFAYAQDLVAPEISPSDPALLVGSWTFVEGFEDSMHFQNYPTAGYQNSSGGTLEVYGRILLDVALGEDGRPVATGSCQVFHRDDFTGSTDWDRSFSQLPLAETAPGVWTAVVEQTFGGNTCHPWNGEKTCSIEVRDDGNGVGHLDYDLTPNYGGFCGRQSRSLSSWGIGHKD